MATVFIGLNEMIETKREAQELISVTFYFFYHDTLSNNLLKTEQCLREQSNLSWALTLNKIIAIARQWVNESQE